MKKRTCLVLCLILIIVSIFAYADGTSSAEGIGNVSEFDKLTGDSKYLGKDYRNNYYLDIIETDIFQAFDAALNAIANVLFGVVRLFAYLVTVIFYQAMSFDVSQHFEHDINAIQSNLRSHIFEPFFIFAFALSSWNIAKNYAQRNAKAIAKEIAQVAFIISVSYFVASNSAVALKGATSITKDIANQGLLNINGKTVTSTNDYAAETAAMLWKSMVHEPWKSLEFGSMINDPNCKITEEEIEDLLSAEYAAGQDKRKKFVKKKYDDSDKVMFSVGQGTARLSVLFVYLVPLVIKGTVYIVAAVIQLAYQLLAVFYVLLAMVILLLSMVPAFGGMEMISAWVRKMIETQVMIVIITFLIGVLIKFDTILFGMTDNLGWFVVIFLETLVAVIVVKKHKTIFKMLGNINRGLQDPNYLKKNLQDSGNVFQTSNKLASAMTLRREQLANNIGRSNPINQEGTNKFNSVRESRVSNATNFESDNNGVNNQKIERPNLFSDFNNNVDQSEKTIKNPTTDKNSKSDNNLGINSTDSKNNSKINQKVETGNNSFEVSSNNFGDTSSFNNDEIKSNKNTIERPTTYTAVTKKNDQNRIKVEAEHTSIRATERADTVSSFSDNHNVNLEKNNIVKETQKQQNKNKLDKTNTINKNDQNDNNKNSNLVEDPHKISVNNSKTSFEEYKNQSTSEQKRPSMSSQRDIDNNISGTAKNYQGEDDNNVSSNNKIIEHKSVGRFSDDDKESSIKVENIRPKTND